MILRTVLGLSVLSLLALAGCATAPAGAPASSKAPRALSLGERVEAAIRSAAPQDGAAVLVSIAFQDLETGESFFREERVRLHAASTMKIPVLVALYRAIDRGEMSFDRLLPIKNQFASLVDGSAFTLLREEDGDPELYDRVGQTESVRELARRMIVRSSNLSTNLLIELLGARAITLAMRDLGAPDIEVLRGVEDEKAFAAGLINTTTAHDLLVILRSIAEKRAVSPAASDEMLGILEQQEFKEKIPAGLPPGTRVANKTGDITAIHHDAAIIFPLGRKPYLLVVLTRGYAVGEEGDRVIAAVSRAVWEHVTAPR